GCFRLHRQLIPKPTHHHTRAHHEQKCRHQNDTGFAHRFSIPSLPDASARYHCAAGEAASRTTGSRLLSSETDTHGGASAGACASPFSFTLINNTDPSSNTLAAIPLIIHASRSNPCSIAASTVRCNRYREICDNRGRSLVADRKSVV